MAVSSANWLVCMSAIFAYFGASFSSLLSNDNGRVQSDSCRWRRQAEWKERWKCPKCVVQQVSIGRDELPHGSLNKGNCPGLRVSLGQLASKVHIHSVEEREREKERAILAPISNDHCLPSAPDTGLDWATQPRDSSSSSPPSIGDIKNIFSSFTLCHFWRNCTLNIHSQRFRLSALFSSSK